MEPDYYQNIKTKENYNLLLNSGMFWEFYPELSGQWHIDKPIIMREYDSQSTHISTDSPTAPTTQHKQEAYSNDTSYQFMYEITFKQSGIVTYEFVYARNILDAISKFYETFGWFDITKVEFIS